MDNAIDKAVKTVMGIISSYSFSDQAYMCTEVADRLRDEAHECLLIEYNLKDDEI
jgi:hypothetical protein